jgi:hypothetical protein
LETQFGNESGYLPRSKLKVVEPKDIQQLKAPANSVALSGSLKLRGIQQVNLKVDVTMFGTNNVAYETSIVLPSKNVKYVPVPTPKLFGSSNFELGLSDVESITRLHYGASDATTSGLDAVASIVQATKPPSLSQQTTRMNDESDNRAAAARLAFCQTHPADCK